VEPVVRDAIRRRAKAPARAVSAQRVVAGRAGRPATACRGGGVHTDRVGAGPAR